MSVLQKPGLVLELSRHTRPGSQSSRRRIWGGGEGMAGLAATSRQPGEQINDDVCRLPNDDCFPCTLQISHRNLCWGHSNSNGILDFKATTETIQTTVTSRHYHHWHFNEDRNGGSVLRNRHSEPTDLDQLAAKACALSHRTQYSWLLLQESSKQWADNKTRWSP